MTLMHEKNINRNRIDSLILYTNDAQIVIIEEFL